MTAGRFRLILASMLGVLIPSAVCANPYWPSFVEHLAMPLDEKIADLPMLMIASIILVPSMLPLVLLETLVTRRFFKGLGFWLSFFTIYFANLVSSLVGYLLLPKGILLWSAVMICYAAAIVLEWLALILVLHQPGQRPKVAFKASVVMNTASYVLMSVILFCLIYVPTYRAEDRSLLKELDGRLLLVSSDSGKLTEVVDIQTRSLRKPDDRDVQAFKSAWYRDWKLLPLTDLQKKILRKFNNDATCPAAFSADGRYCAFYDYGTVCVVDLKTGRSSKMDDGFDVRAMSFHPKEPVVALGSGFIILLDCRNMKAKGVTMPGNTSYDSPFLTWSPDGRYLAYWANHMSGLAMERGRSNLRVITADGKRSVTLYPKMPYGWRRLVWVE